MSKLYTALALTLALTLSHDGHAAIPSSIITAMRHDICMRGGHVYYPRLSEADKKEYDRITQPLYSTDMAGLQGFCHTLGTPLKPL